MRTLAEEIVVPAREARWLSVLAGVVLEIVDLEGRQVGDLMAYLPDRPEEYFSPPHTCSCLTKLVPEVGDELFSNHRRPLLRLLRDDVGRHDFIVPCCDRERYQGDFGISDHGSCLESLQLALDEFGSDWKPRGELAGNIFMNNVLTKDGRIETRAPEQGAGACLGLLVLEDLVVGLSACPQDLTPCNDFNPTAMALRVWEGDERPV
jgi:uncharacterized protein YcgI (DUF1989 family)